MKKIFILFVLFSQASLAEQIFVSKTSLVGSVCRFYLSSLGNEDHLPITTSAEDPFEPLVPFFRSHPFNEVLADIKRIHVKNNIPGLIDIDLSDLITTEMRATIQQRLKNFDNLNLQNIAESIGAGPNRHEKFMALRVHSHGGEDGESPKVGLWTGDTTKWGAVKGISSVGFLLFYEWLENLLPGKRMLVKAHYGAGVQYPYNWHRDSSYFTIIFNLLGPGAAALDEKTNQIISIPEGHLWIMAGSQQKVVQPPLHTSPLVAEFRGALFLFTDDPTDHPLLTSYRWLSGVKP